MIEQHYCIKLVADKLGVSEQTVRRWIQERKLYAIRIGKEYRIPESAIEQARLNVANDSK